MASRKLRLIMQSSNHFCFGDTCNQGLLDCRRRRDTQRMAIQTSFAEKVTGFHNSYDCFLAPLGNDGEPILPFWCNKRRPQDRPA